MLVLFVMIERRQAEPMLDLRPFRVPAISPSLMAALLQGMTSFAALFNYAQLSTTTGLWLVVVASVINGIGASSFFPANSSAVMKASPPALFGVSSGLHAAFYASMGMMALAAILSATRASRAHPVRA